MIFGAFGGCRVTFDFFRITKFDMFAEATMLERLDVKKTFEFEIILAMELFQWILFLLNLI